MLLSGFLPVPSGAVIVLVSSVLFYGSLLLKPVLGRGGVSQSEL
jgi:ABC-type Mn2+/Zn2+ transport system permease subunit